MNEKKAKEILEEEVFTKNGGLYSSGWYLNWEINERDAFLDGIFTADELEAIAWWMHNKKK